MRRLLTGYAISYNYRHRRHGHLFQNRYKSILCQEDTYLLELVRYIHLNPLRAGIVRDIGRLHRYPYCGHSVLLGKYDRDWQDTDYVLRLFDNTVSGEYDLKAKGYDFEAVVERVAELLEMKANQVLTNRKNKQAVRARSLVCFWAFSELGINQIELAQRFGISQPAVSSAVRKGEEIARTNDYELLKNRKL